MEKLDIHTHNPNPDWPAIIHLEARAGMSAVPEGSRLYSLGIHPWEAGGDDTEARLQSIERLAGDERVRAIGECGLDRLRGPAAQTQRSVFEAQARIAARHGLPLIIHCVRAWDELMDVKRRIEGEGGERPARWIVHGFRGKPELARQLLGAGFELSYGLRFNPESLRITPPGLRHCETDDAGVSLVQVIEAQEGSTTEHTAEHK